jgi:hypothetical protein
MSGRKNPSHKKGGISGSNSVRAGDSAPAVFSQKAASKKAAVSPASGNQPPKKEGWLRRSLKNEHMQTFLLSFAIVIGMLIYFFLTAKAVPMQTAVIEEPLVQVANVSVLPGEGYIYVVRTQDGAEVVGYKASKKASCPGVFVEAYSESAGAEGHCISTDGRAIGEPAPSNMSSTNSTFLLFAPWMLAAHDGWKWSIRTEVREGNFGTVGSEEMVFSARSSTWGGRDALLVMASVQNQTIAMFFVDGETRVLLYMESGGMNATLVEAPFYPKKNETGKE